MNKQERINDLIYMISPMEGEPRLPEDWTDEELKLVFKWGVDNDMYLDKLVPDIETAIKWADG